MSTLKLKTALASAALLALMAIPATAQPPIISASSYQEPEPVAQPSIEPAPVTGQDYFGGNNGCNTGCNDGCNTGRCGLFGRGIIKPSDHAFDCFISPMTNPIFFEDPRQLTEARAIFFNHKVPLEAGGGDVNLYAVQLRARLSENVSLIATKDGYVTSSNPFVQDGWADLSAGLKFSLIRDVARQRLLSAGFTFELPTGEASAFQGNGDGELNLFYSYGRAIGQRMHFLTGGGFRLPMNSSDESTSSYLSFHLDYMARRGVYLFSELNWYHWLKSGQDGPIPGIEGLDVINFGNPSVAGNDIVTNAYGVKFKPNCHNEVGVAFEFPLTDRRDIIDNRLTVDWIIRY